MVPTANPAKLGSRPARTERNVSTRFDADLTQSGDGDLDHEIAAMEHVGEVLMDQANASLADHELRAGHRRRGARVPAG